MLLIIKKCPRCGREFRQRVRSGNGRKYCSKGCRYSKKQIRAIMND